MNAEHLIAQVKARRLSQGLTVKVTMDGKTSDHSFATVAGRDDFVRRLQRQGIKHEIAKA